MSPQPENANSTEDLIDLLRLWFDPSPARAQSKNHNIDWPRLLGIAQRTKTASLLTDALERGKITPPSTIELNLKAINGDILKSNLANFAWSLKIHDVFEHAKIKAVTYKGTTRAKTVYGAWGKRRSADIDVIVPKPDFTRAMQALLAEGFVPMVSQKSRWWSEFLGEVPFHHPEANHLHIDLHHSLQQPGGPYPKDLSGFFAASVVEQHSGKSIRHFTPEHELLIAAISYGKAVRAGEPWLSYAHEIVHTHLTASAEQRRRTQDLAKKNGLSRLYTELVRNSFSLFEIEDKFSQSNPRHAIDLESMRLSAAGLTENPRFFRGTKLWQWQDGPLLPRMYRFAREQARVIQGQMAFDKEKSPAR